MVADVYADLASPSVDDDLVEFLVEADAAPDVLCRLSAIICLTNRVPYSTGLKTQPDHSLIVTFAVRGVAAEKADLIVRQLERLTCVIRAESHRCSEAGPPATEGDSHLA